MRGAPPAPMLLLVNPQRRPPGRPNTEENPMLSITNTPRKLTKTLAVAIAALGMAALPVQAAHADRAATAVVAPATAGDARPAPAPTQLADTPREPLRSCYDYAYEIYISSGWWEAASAYLDCHGNPNHPDNDEKP